jgi:hypothetical protein
LIEFSDIRSFLTKKMRVSASPFVAIIAFLATVVTAWTSGASHHRHSPRTHVILNADSKVSAGSDEKVAFDNDDEALFKNQCKDLCIERNFAFTKIKNARDLSSVRNSPIKPGRILRMGRVSDATESDIKLLMQDLDLRTLVDLRSPTELKADPTLMREEVFDNFTSVVWMEKGRKKDGCDEKEIAKVVVDAVLNEDHEQVMEVLAREDEEDDEEDNEEDCGYDAHCEDEEDTGLPYKLGQYKGNRKERHFVSLMNEFKYVKGTVSKVRKRDIMNQ